MPKENFRREVEKELTGKKGEPSEPLYFEGYRSQVPVLDQAIETAALMCRSDKSGRLSGGAEPGAWKRGIGRRMRRKCQKPRTMRPWPALGLGASMDRSFVVMSFDRPKGNKPSPILREEAAEPMRPQAGVIDGENWLC